MNAEQIHTELMREFGAAHQPMIERFREKLERENRQPQNDAELFQMLREDTSRYVIETIDAAMTAVAKVIASR